MNIPGSKVCSLMLALKAVDYKQRLRIKISAKCINKPQLIVKVIFLKCIK